MSRSGGILMPADGRRFASGLYYCTDDATADTVMTPIQDQLYLNAFTVGATATFNQLSLEVTVASATATMDLAVFDSSAAGGQPGLKLAGGNVSAAATGVMTAAIALTLPPGLYWIGSVTHTATLPTLRAKSVPGTRWVGQAGGGNANATTYVNGATPGAPGNNPAVGISQSGAVPKVMLRAA